MSASITANTDTEEPNSSRWYIYIIENRLGQFYTGITSDPVRRIAQHRGEKTGGAKALKNKNPLSFKVVFSVESKNEALKIEASIKKLSKRQKIKIVEQLLLPVTTSYSVHHNYLSV